MSSVIILALILGVRLLVAALAANAGGEASRDAPAPLRWLRVLRIVLLPVALGLCVALAGGMLWAAPALAINAAVLLPWPLARWVLIPLGLPRLAFWTVSIADWTFVADRRGGAALAGAWALCRARERDDEAAAWLEERLNEAPAPVEEGEDPRKLRASDASFHPLRGAGIAAAAMLASYRGDLEGARALFESVAMLDERACPPVARRVAKRWLAADAAARGDWEKVAELSADGMVEGRDLGLLGAIARRLLDARAAIGEAPRWAADVALWIYWIVAPNRVATLPLVRRALSSARRAPAPRAEGPEIRAAAVPEGDRWGRAVALHASLLVKAEGQITGDDLRRLGGAWDAAFEDEAAQAEVRERALTIGAASADATLGALRRSAAEDLANLARAAGVPHSAWEDLGETVGRATRLLRDELLAELELTCDRLRRRVDDRRELPASDEWREWVALKTQYERAAELVGPELRRLAFPKVDSDVCHLAVWLFNVRRQRALSNAMFRWLLAEAEALGDQRSADLSRKNIACGV